MINPNHSGLFYVDEQKRVILDDVSEFFYNHPVIAYTSMFITWAAAEIALWNICEVL